MTLAPHLPLGGIIPGGPELIVILVILVLLFGATKLPQLAKGLGQSIKEFKKASKENEDAEEKSASETKVASAKPVESGKHGNN